MNNPQSTLRGRLSSAKKWLGTEKSHHSKVLLGLQTLLRYRQKLQPIFSHAFFEKLENFGEDSPQFDESKTRLVLEHSLTVPLATVANLQLQPGDKHFPFWLFVSVYFPVIAACVAPLGNLISLVALLDHWQVYPKTGLTIPDKFQTLVLSALAFGLGIVGNFSLLLNFSGKLQYILAQSVSIFCFSVAAIFLLVEVLLANTRIKHSVLESSEGFWLAVFTVAIYTLCTSVLVTNLAGYNLKKYQAKFNLSKKQRSLLSYTIAFSVWQAVGTVVMAKLIPHITFGTSLYYCTGSILTIGLGDVVPRSPGARAFALVFSFIGFLIIGLVISVLRQVVLYSEGSSLFWHRVEKKRLKFLKSLEKENPGFQMSRSRAFAEMRKIRSDVRSGQQRRSFILTLLVFIMFWLVGAMVYFKVEGWGYFEALYFCGLCLWTIGYGDVHPVQPLSKVFFVVWAISAVPLMTILISIIGDTLYDISSKLNFAAAKMFDSKTYTWVLKGDRDLTSQCESEGQSDREISPCPFDIDSQNLEERFKCQVRLTQNIANSFALLKKVMRDSLDFPGREYEYIVWARHLRQFPSANSGENGFWTGDLSPLRLPLNESNYLLLKMIKKIEDNMETLRFYRERLLEMSEIKTPRSCKPILLISRWERDKR